MLAAPPDITPPIVTSLAKGKRRLEEPNRAVRLPTSQDSRLCISLNGQKFEQNDVVQALIINMSALVAENPTEQSEARRKLLAAGYSWIYLFPSVTRATVQWRFCSSRCLREHVSAL
ncbi:hypothetical protein Cni_G18755 [Canna indica]|uniref:Uncharacterized protein n=1 Tax=Canna indica TaxID=4628 RepID=A0AAQ3KQ99_9LILI|nr:hypothetical protein Cni_G18755 [Canna indica]